MAKVIRKSATSFVGWFPSIKNNRMIWFDSLSTLWRFFYLEFDPDCSTYKSQPFSRKSTAFNGEPHYYTPDILAKRKPRWQLIECKVEKSLNSKHTLQQVTIGKAICEEEDWDFLLSIKERLQEGPRLNNYKLIYYYARLGIPHRIFTDCKSIMSTNTNGILLKELAFALSGARTMEYAPYLYSLIFQHYLYIAWDEQITENSVLYTASSRG